MKAFSRRLLLFAAWFLVLAPIPAGQESPEARPFTIVTFGDSTTALRRGFNVYTSQLEVRFKSAAIPVRFLNKGVPGDTTEMARKRFPADVLREKPDLVILQFGINDSDFDVWKTPPATSPNVTLARYGENLRYFISAVRKSGAEAVLMTPNQMRWTPKLLGLYGKPPYDSNDPMGMTRPMEPYVDSVRRIARDLDVPLVDVYANFGQWEQSHGRSCSELLSDGMHPNTPGHTLIADALEPLVAQAIIRRTGAGKDHPP